MEDYDKRIDNILEILYQIDFSKKTILTGSNASGKSLIRKQLHQPYKEKFGVLPKIKSTSMQLRTERRAEWGALSSVMSDTEWIATSANSIHLIKGIIEHQDKCNYLVFDEPEIGCSYEVQRGIAKYINENVTTPFLLISHSNEIINNLNFDVFLNLNGLSYEQYINREIKIITLEELKNDSDKMFEAIKERLRKI